MSANYAKVIDTACQWLLEEGEKKGSFYFTKKIKRDQQIETEKKQPTPTYFFPDKLKECEILLLDFQTKVEDAALLKRLCHAINERIAPAFYFSIENLDCNYLDALKSQIINVRWLLFSEPKLYLSVKLASHYQKQPHRSLFSKPLFLLNELSVYDQNPELKKNLWSTLLKTL